MKRFTINCDFGGQMSPFNVYIGHPKLGHHLLHHQADWLSKTRGGIIPGEVMDALEQVQDVATRNKVHPEDLCVYVLAISEEEDDNSNDESDDE